MTTNNEHAATDKQVGRRPLVLDPEIRKAVIQALEAGNYMETAAEYAGIHKSVLFDWLAWGREARQQIQDGTEIRPNGHAYAEFTDEVEKAMARVEVQSVAVIRRHAVDNWQAMAWYLERTRPRKFGRLDRKEVSGPDSGPVEITVDSQRAKAAELLDEIAERLGE